MWGLIINNNNIMKTVNKSKTKSNSKGGKTYTKSKTSVGGVKTKTKSVKINSGNFAGATSSVTKTKIKGNKAIKSTSNPMVATKFKGDSGYGKQKRQVAKNVRKGMKK